MFITKSNVFFENFIFSFGMINVLGRHVDHWWNKLNLFTKSKETVSLLYLRGMSGIMLFL